MRAIKHFFLYTNKIHALALFVIAPVLALLQGCALTLAMKFSGEHMDIPFLIISPWYLFGMSAYEVFADSRTFGGTLCRGASDAEWIKCSDRCLPFYKDILLGDQISRAALHVYSFGAYALITGLIRSRDISGTLSDWLFVSAVSWGIAQVFIVIERLIRESNTNLIVVITLAGAATVASAVVIFFFTLSIVMDETMHPPFYWIAICIAFIAGLIAWVFLCVYGLWKKKEEYHDL